MDGANSGSDHDGFEEALTVIKASQSNKQAVQDACTICLEPISERAVAVPCNHLSFDFLCLTSWLQEQPICPLCKSKVTAVQYDWRGPEDYITYNVPELKASQTIRTFRQAHWRYPLPRRSRHVHQPRGYTVPSSGRDSSLERRRELYRDRLYSSHVGANRISQYRNFTVHDFNLSLALQSRARTFLRRELRVFTFLDSGSRGGNRDFLIEYIVGVLKHNELRGAEGKAEELVKDFLGLQNARQLLHELEAWLRSPYMSLRDWDAHAQYSIRQHNSPSVRAYRSQSR